MTDWRIDHKTRFLQQITSWIAANLLTRNCSKSELLLIGLKKRLAKIHNVSLNTIHSACNPVIIFDEYLNFSDQSSSLSKSCYYHIRQHCRIVPAPTYIPKHPLPLSLPSFAPNLIIANLFTTIALSLK